jgi:hypothetical protein
MNEDGIKITGGTFPTVAGKNWTSPMDCDPQDGALVEYEFVGRNGPVIRSGWWNASTRCFIADAPYDNTDSRGARGVTCWRVPAPKEEAEIALAAEREKSAQLDRELRAALRRESTALGASDTFRLEFIRANEDCSALRAESDRLGYKLDAAERRIAQLEAERSEPDPDPDFERAMEAGIRYFLGVSTRAAQAIVDSLRKGGVPLGALSVPLAASIILHELTLHRPVEAEALPVEEIRPGRWLTEGVAYSAGAGWVSTSDLAKLCDLVEADTGAGNPLGEGE